MQGDPLGFEILGKTSLEIQNSGISGPVKKTNFPKKNPSHGTYMLPQALFRNSSLQKKTFLGSLATCVCHMQS